jgi:DNA topoisomerase IB
MRLPRVDPAGPGLGRRRRGWGFEYLDHSGDWVVDFETVELVRSLAIPPALRTSTRGSSTGSALE